MKIFAIETSCDETGLAYIQINTKKKEVTLLAEELASQTNIHQEYGGVFPAVARREHGKIIGHLVTKILRTSKSYKKQEIADKRKINKIKKILTRESEVLAYFEKELFFVKKPDIDYIGVTIGPGLEPALWIGISTARALGELWEIPVIPINHMYGHIVSTQIDAKELESGKHSEIKNLTYPILSLLVSGGHTELVLSKKITRHKILGKTRDDAAGECFDKCARMLGLPYPGGPEVSKLAKEARKSHISKLLTLPRPMIHTKDFDFSYSGLKTSLLYALRDLGKDLSLDEKKSISREVEEAIVDVLVHKTIKALEKTDAQTLVVGGGVACNSWLKERLIKEVEDKYKNINIYFPDKKIATDNGIMIALATYFQIEAQGIKKRYSWKAKGNLEL